MHTAPLQVLCWCVRRPCRGRRVSQVHVTSLTPSVLWWGRKKVEAIVWKQTPIADPNITELFHQTVRKDRRGPTHTRERSLEVKTQNCRFWNVNAVNVFKLKWQQSCPVARPPFSLNTMCTVMCCYEVKNHMSLCSEYILRTFPWVKQKAKK